MLISRKIIALAAVSTIFLAGCSSNSAESAAESPATSTNASSCGTTVEEIAAAAKTEGKVELIALPDTWANYKGVLDTFKAKYGIEAPVANPDASSADELTAISTLRGQPGMPEVIDIGPSFTKEFIENGWNAPYKTTNWDEIPDALKDPDGNWIGTYTGVMSIAYNSALVENAPTSWADLKKPEYKGQVTINGDPREAGAAFAAVMAASLANGGSFDDIMPGIEYFAELKKAGNLSQADITPAAIISGDAPIALDWSYNFPGLQAELATAGFEMPVITPTDGLYVGYYAQAAVSEAVHPCAAQLWLEHISGNDGALEFLKGGAIPARYAAMLDAGVIPADLAAGLPTKEAWAAIKFPSQAQIDAAKLLLTDNWGPMVSD